MKIHSIIAILVLLLLVPSSMRAGNRRYVTEAGAGQADGTSWADASANLQRTIDLSQRGDTVWVAAGTYYGGFVMRDGVTVLGGFRGDEKELSDRAQDPMQNRTILNGDGTYRVLLQEGDFETQTRWDGFVLTGGVGTKGAGAVIRQGGVLSHCHICQNQAAMPAIGEYIEKAGGVYFAQRSGKALVLATIEVGRNYQFARAQEVAASYQEGGFSDWRLPSSSELRHLLPLNATSYCTYVQSELSLAEHKLTPLYGKSVWTSTTASSNGMQGAGVCDFKGMRSMNINTCQYNKVRLIREYILTPWDGQGGGVYATGGLLDACTIEGNTASAGSAAYCRGDVEFRNCQVQMADIDADEHLILTDDDQDAIKNPGETIRISHSWHCGQSINLRSGGVLRAELYDLSGRCIGRTIHGELTAPPHPCQLILSAHSANGKTISYRINVTD